MKIHSRLSGDKISTPKDPGTDIPREIPARRGFSVSYRGKTLLSRIDPVAQGERLAASIPVRERTLYFCPSPLYGYGLTLLLDRIPENSAILCVEADNMLFEISHTALDKLTCSAGDKLLPPIALLHTLSAESLCTFVRETWGQRRFRRIEPVRFGGGWQLYPQLYEDLAAALKREMAVQWGNAMTMIRLGRLYARNLIRNLALLPQGQDINALDFASAPVLVLGAGPSLDPLLDKLSALSDGKISGPGKRPYKIICVDTCLPALHEREILPDLAIVLESQHWNLRDFSGACGRKIDAALDLSVLPASGRVLGGKRFFFATLWTSLALFRRLEDAGLLPETFAPLGSVGLSAVAIALRIGRGPVLCAGLDFSYTLDCYHARCTSGYTDNERRQNRFRSIINAGAAFREESFIVPSKTAGLVRSDPGMQNYRDLFEQEFGSNTRLLDIAGSGLPLGVKIISHDEALAILRGNQKASLPGSSENSPATVKPEKKICARQIAGFVRREIDTLNVLLNALSGERPVDPPRLEELLDIADYLWAHFPDCAGAGGRRPPCTDLSFLKRVRTEIEPFLMLWKMTLTNEQMNK